MAAEGLWDGGGPEGCAGKIVAQRTATLKSTSLAVCARVQVAGAGIRSAVQRQRFAFHLTTDGVSARVQFAADGASSQAPAAPSTRPSTRPTRGLFTIREMQSHYPDLEDLHVIGIDPGMNEIIVAMDRDAVNRACHNLEPIRLWLVVLSNALLPELLPPPTLPQEIPRRRGPCVTR